MPFVSDTFTDVGGTLLTAHTGEIGATWTEHAFSTASHDAMISDTNRCRSSTITPGAVYTYASGVPATADYTIQCVLQQINTLTDSAAGVIGRLDTAANTMYGAWYRNPATGAWQLVKIVAGTSTVLGSFTQALAAATNYTMDLVMAGSSLTVKVDGVSRITATDTAITAAGRAGVRVNISSNAQGVHIDSMSAEDAAISASGTATVSGGGTVAVSSRKDGKSAVTASAGGTIATPGRKGALSSVTISGGGTVAAANPPTRQSAVTVSGRGNVTVVVSKTGKSVLTVTGGGAVTISTTPLVPLPGNLRLSASQASALGFTARGFDMLEGNVARLNVTLTNAAGTVVVGSGMTATLYNVETGASVAATVQTVDGKPVVEVAPVAGRYVLRVVATTPKAAGEKRLRVLRTGQRVS